MKWGLENKIRAGFGLALLVLVAVSALAYLSMTRLIKADRWVAHTHDVLAELESILNELDHSESGERGYILIGDDHFLSDYQAGSTGVYGHIQRVKDLTQDNPNQQQRLEYLIPRIDERLAILKDAVDARRKQGFEAAKQIVASGRGRDQMVEIRSIITEMENEEKSLLARRVKEDEASTRNTIWTIAAFIFAAFALLGIGAYFINRDFAGRTRTAKLLYDSERKYRTLFDSIDEGFCIVEMLFDENNKPVDYRFLDTNPSFEKQTGISNALGKRMREIAPQHEEHWFELYGKIALTGEPARFENEAAQLHRWFEVFAFRIGEAKQKKVAILFNDITTRKRTEGEMQALNRVLQQRTVELTAVNKELEAFSYSVSHDLRAPLRHIDGFSKLLVEQHIAALPEEAREYITLIRESTTEMGQLVDDLLNLARVGRAELSLELTGLNSVVEGVVGEIKRNTTQREIEWKVQKLPFVECDPGLIRQVFANLLSNSVKFTRQREQALIEVGSTEHDGQPIIFVRDNGVGFSMKHADKLFRVFQRLHRQEDFEGTGVGLATIQRIIQKHGGRVWAESELNQGATFYFSLCGSQDIKTKTQAV